MKSYAVYAQVLFYPPEQGGRVEVPVNNGYAPYIRSDALDGDLPVRINGMPAKGKFNVTYNIEVELSYHPKIDYSALVDGTSFELLEGSRIVATGIIMNPRANQER